MITHDEQFVESLARSDLLDEVFRISRDQDGHSLIRREPVDLFRDR